MRFLSFPFGTGRKTQMLLIFYFAKVKYIYILYMEHEFLESLPLADLNVSLNPFESFICQLEEHPLSQCERS